MKLFIIVFKLRYFLLGKRLKNNSYRFMLYISDQNLNFNID